MSSTPLHEWHKNQSDHNFQTQTFLETKTPDYLDWEINAIFYATVKLVDAYFIKHGHGKPFDHTSRRTMIKRYLLQIRGEYKKLELLSKQSRYDGPVNLNNKSAANMWSSSISSYVNSVF